MRALSVAAANLANTTTGTEPFNTVEIDWVITPPGQSPTNITTIYSDRTIPNISIEGFILEIGNLDEVVKLSDKATASQVSITFDDQTGAFKNRLDNFDVQKRPLRIYQCYLDSTFQYQRDKFIVFAGEIVTPIAWNERQRKVTLEADRKSTRLNSSHIPLSRMPSSA